MRQAAFFLAFPRGAIDQVNVLIAVVVIVEESCAFSVDVDQVLCDLISADDLEVESGLLGDIRENRECPFRVAGWESRIPPHQEHGQYEHDNGQELQEDSKRAMLTTPICRVGKHRMSLATATVPFNTPAVWS